MKILLELAKILTSKKLEKIDFPAEIQRPNSKTNFARLFWGIKSGEFRTDTGASRAIYGEMPSSARYQKLKSRLKERMINSAFLFRITEGSQTEGDAIAAQCERNLYVISVFLPLGAYETCRWLAERTYEMADAQHLPLIQLRCLLYMRVIYSVLKIPGEKISSEELKQCIEKISRDL